jgi:glycine dehydrogenase
MEIAGASLLDEGTAAAEAMAMAVNIAATKPRAGSSSRVTATRRRSRWCARGRGTMGIEVVVGDRRRVRLRGTWRGFRGVLVQYPTTDGRVECYRELASRAHAAGTGGRRGGDLLALTLLTPPGEWGATSHRQRAAVRRADGLRRAARGVHGDHGEHVRGCRAARRRVEGRARAARAAAGDPDARAAHPRDRATSNICTAQVLLAVMAGMYGVYHGPTG